MGKFKSTMKAIGTGVAIVGVAAASVAAQEANPQYWYDQAADAARRGRGELALHYVQRGLEAERRRRYRDCTTNRPRRGKETS